MKVARPTAQQERWLVLAARYPQLRPLVEHAGHGAAWKTTTLLARALGFLLGLLAAGLLAGAMSLVPAPWFIGGMLLVLAAEWLVAKRRVFRAGIEEALYLCGAVALAVQLLLWSSGTNAGAGVALVATAVLLCGWRLLNPLFTTLAAAGYSLAVALAGQRLFDGNPHTLAAGTFCAALAIAAWLAGARTWQRPAHDRMLDGLVIVMPWCACAWFAAWASQGPRLREWLALAVAVAFLAAGIAAGVRRRVHAPFIAALGCAAFAAFATHRLLSWPLYWQLIADGAVLLAASVILERRLRHRDAGITSRALEPEQAAALLQMAGAAQLAPAPGAAPAGFHGEGGGFAGGGASGRF